MGLEAPLALLGLLGVLIPVLAHRMRNRELPRVVLPTFALLVRAAALSRRRRSLSDVVLLLLRMAMIALAALGLAAPYIDARVLFGDGHAASVAIVIDDSLSMARQDAGASLMEQARTRAQDVISALQDGSEVSLVMGGRPARVLLPLSNDLPQARRALDALPPAVREGDLPAAVELAFSQLNRGRAGTKRMLLLSDFARHNAAVTGPEGVEFSAERIGDPPRTANLFIDEAHAAADPTRPNELSLAVTVRTTPATPSLHAKLEVSFAGNTSTSSVLTFERGFARTVLHVPNSATSGAARVRIVSADSLAADNEISVLSGHSAGVGVLLVNGDPHPASRKDELFYATRALALVPDAVLSLRTQSVDPLSFEHVTLADSDVIVLANAPVPGDALAQRLFEFVSKGGGLIIAAGSRVDPARYNAVLGALLPSHIRGLGRANGLHFAPGNLPNFLSEGMLGLREAVTQERLLLEEGAAETLLSFDDGSPALTARSVGEGRCLLFAASLDTDFGDLPFRPGFMPLLAAMIRDAAGAAAATRGRIAAGESVTLPRARGGGFVEVRSPQGRVERFSNVDGSIRFGATDSLGVFQIRTEHGATATFRDAFVVDPPKSESDLSPGPTPASSKRIGNATHVTVHKPLATSVWLGLFMLMVVEALLRARGTVWNASALPRSA